MRNVFAAADIAGVAVLVLVIVFVK